MPIPLPQKFRRPFVELYKDGEGIPQKIGKRFHVAQDTADRWTYLQKCLGVLLSKSHGTGSRPKALAILLYFFTVFTSNYVFSNTIAAGYSHTVLLTEKCQVYTFGSGESGQLGRGNREWQSTPTLITGLQDITAIAAGFYHTILLNKNGQVYTFGSGRDGRLGHEDQEDKSTPTLITGLQNRITAVDGSDHTVLLTEDGQVYTFGSGQYGQLGHENRNSKITPTLITGLQDKITAIAAGFYQTVLLTEEGQVYTFGDGGFGQLGHGDLKNKTIPTLITGLQGRITAITVGFHHTVLLTEEGLVYTFGGGQHGQLGHGDQELKTTPTLITGLQDRVTAIAAGAYHTVLLTENSQIYTFGSGGEFDQLGHGDFNRKTRPTKVLNIQPIMQPLPKKRIKSAASVADFCLLGF